MPRIRADQLLVERGLAESRTRAQALILAGLAYAGTRKLAKAGEALAPDAELTVRGRDHPWVSRGGIKLDHGLARFGWDVGGAVAMDVGSSTGGFTDVLLARGAARVYAVDSGTNQLAWKLRQDPRVVVLEQQNARHLADAQVPEPIDLLVCDASFIALAKVMARPLAFAAPAARALVLVKPQFEAGRDEVGWFAERGWTVAGVERSPITGPEGNVEFLLAATRGGSAASSAAPAGVGADDPSGAGRRGPTARDGDGGRQP